MRVTLHYHKAYYAGLYALAQHKGIVHPKMKIKSLITHPHALPIP